MIFRRKTNKNKDKDEDKEKENILNSFNIEILDSILDDDDDKFLQLISQHIVGDSNFSKRFKITNYKLPKIFCSKPSYSSLCAGFGAEKCFNALLSLYPDGIKSKDFNIADESGRTPIHFASFSGNLSILRLYYQAGFDLNDKDLTRRTPSHYSAISGTTDAMKYIWTKGIDILAQADYMQMTPLHVACEYGNLEVVKFLCENVANNVNKILESTSYHNRYWKTKTPLHLACEFGCVEIVNYFLSKKELARSQIRELDSYSRTPLHCAIEGGSLECVKSLVNIGKANITNQGRIHVALIDAAAGGYADIVSFLLLQGGIEINAVNSQKLTALDAAIMNDHIDIVRFLINNGASQDLNDKKISNLFLEGLCTMNMKLINYLDEVLNVPYSKMGNLFMKQAVILESEELVNYLIDKKCPLTNVADKVNFRGKWTPFMTFLKDKGFNLSEYNESGATPIIVKAIRLGNIESVKDLLSKGIELNKEIISNFDCINNVCKKGKFDLFNMLMEYKPEIKDPANCIESLISLIKDQKTKNRPNQQYISNYFQMAETLFNNYKIEIKSNSRTVSKAIYSRSIDVLELLVKNSVDFSDCAFDYSLCTDQGFMPIFEFLEKHGCKFNKNEPLNNFFGFQDEENDSPLMNNISRRKGYKYDINTLIFLVKYADNDELEKDINDEENIIDILLNFDRLDGILEVYKKLGKIVYPKQMTNHAYLYWIRHCGTRELIDFVQKHT